MDKTVIYSLGQLWAYCKALGFSTKRTNDPFDKVWRDNTSELFIRSGVNAPTSTSFIGGIDQYEFVSNLTKTVFSNFHINHDYALGTVLFPHLHFSVKSNNAGNVVLEFEWSIAKGHSQASFPATTTKTLIFPVPANSAFKHFIAELPTIDAISGTGIEPDTLILMRISRIGANAADTFPDSIWGATADLHYQANLRGTLNKAPNFYA